MWDKSEPQKGGGRKDKENEKKKRRRGKTPRPPWHTPQEFLLLPKTTFLKKQKSRFPKLTSNFYSSTSFSDPVLTTFTFPTSENKVLISVQKPFFENERYLWDTPHILFEKTVPQNKKDFINDCGCCLPRVSWLKPLLSTRWQFLRTSRRRWKRSAISHGNSMWCLL